jgi:hypothetical protein
MSVQSRSTGSVVFALTCENPVMRMRSIGACAVMILGFFAGCGKGPADGNFPAASPLWIVEDDPNGSVMSPEEVAAFGPKWTAKFDRHDLTRDRNVHPMLVIPLYKNYRHQGAADELAIAHPFLYRQGEEIEEKLTSLGQRENLRRLIVWVPGFFPGSIGRIFRGEHTINGKTMIVLELQPCLGSEAREINGAMKALLVGGDFVAGKESFCAPPPPPHTDEIRATNQPYDASQLVRSMEYCGRFYQNGAAMVVHVLWGYEVKTKIANRLSPEDKNIVASFAARAESKGTPDGGQARPAGQSNGAGKVTK